MRMRRKSLDRVKEGPRTDARVKGNSHGRNRMRGWVPEAVEGELGMVRSWHYISYTP